MKRLLNKSRARTVMMVVMIVAAFGAQALADITLDFALWINDATEVPMVEALIRQYEEENPGVKIELYHEPFAGYHDKMTTFASTGLLPDVLAVSRVFLPAYAEAGILQPIGSMLDRLGVDPDNDVTEIHSGTYKGDIYGIPIWGGPYVLMYNMDMMAEAGIPFASELYASGEWTWDTFIDVGKKLTRDRTGDGINDVWAANTPILGEVDWAAKIGQFGGRVFDDNQTTTLLNSPEARDALALWADIALTHGIAPIPDEPEGSFPAGTLAFLGRWTASTITMSRQIGNDFNMDIVPQPAGPAGHFHIAGGVPIAVSSTTPHFEEAAKFAVWYTMESEQWKILGIPASVRDLTQGYRELLAEHFPNADAAFDALMMPTSPEPAIGLKRDAIISAWNPSLDKLRRGEIPVETAIAELTSVLNAILAE